MKIRSSVKPICPKCKTIKRNRTLYVLCSAFPKHKQRQNKPKKP